MHRRRVFAVVALALLAPGGGGCVVEHFREPPYLRAVPCWFDAPPGQQAECGRMYVREDPQRPESRKISFPVVTFKTPAAAPQPDPLVVLGGGGPGYAVGLDGDYAADFFAGAESFALRQGRDLIVVDVRGVGLSEPVLRCPELIGAVEHLYQRHVPLATEAAAYAEAARACRERLTSRNIRLETYNSAINAHDIELLRTAMGYARWNLLGVSYGARLALTLLRDFPAGVRSLILDSPEIPSGNAYEDGAATTTRAFREMFAACRRDRRCNLAHPEARQRLAALVERLEQSPVTVPIEHPYSGADFSFVLTGRRLAEIIFYSMYYPEEIPDWPARLQRLDRLGVIDPALLEQHMADLLSADFSDGVYYSTLCREELPFNNLAATPRRLGGYLPALLLQETWVKTEQAVCQAWAVAPAPQLETQPVLSATPALILMGHFDPVIPPGWGRRIQRQLVNSLLVEFPAESHNVLHADNECAQRLAAAFLDAPGTRPRPACVEALQTRPAAARPAAARD